MKKNILALVAAAAMMTACNNQQPALDPQPAGEQAPQTVTIAYIEVDSVMSLYTFSKEKTLELEKKRNNAQNTLIQKGNQLQQAANNFQQKWQNNGFSSREQAESVQAALQRQESDLEALRARLENELASESAKFMQAFQDSLTHFLEDYNRDKHFSVILNKGAILLAGEQLDITQEVVEGLNRRYKPAAPAKKEAAQ